MCHSQVGEGVRVGVGCKVYFRLRVTITHVTCESVMFPLGFYFAHLFSVGTSSPCYSALYPTEVSLVAVLPPSLSLLPSTIPHSEEN